MWKQGVAVDDHGTLEGQHHRMDFPQFAGKTNLILARDRRAWRQLYLHGYLVPPTTWRSRDKVQLMPCSNHLGTFFCSKQRLMDTVGGLGFIFTLFQRGRCTTLESVCVLPRMVHSRTVPEKSSCPPPPSQKLNYQHCYCDFQ
ncbi:uncharacterized protein LOC144880347 [Branchiostoma floridae x Branchiostoma japonicum]